MTTQGDIAVLKASTERRGPEPSPGPGLSPEEPSCRQRPKGAKRKESSSGVEKYSKQREQQGESLEALESVTRSEERVGWREGLRGTPG